MLFGKFLTTTLFSSVLMIGSTALACSFGQSMVEFEPDHARWERYVKSMQGDGGSDQAEPIPAPVISELDIMRGTEEPGSSCGDAGMISFVISVPEGSSYAIHDFGVYFRVSEGTAPAGLFPDVPVTGIVLGKNEGFQIPWLDGHPSQQQPIKFLLEVFFVSNGLSIGPSTLVEVDSE